MMSASTRTVRATLALVALGLSTARGAQEAPEYRIKANFLYNLGTREMAVWPKEAFPEADSPFRIGVLGKDPFGDELEAASLNRPAQGRDVRIIRAARINALKTAHLIFVPKGESGRLKQLLAAVKGSKTLVVGESPGAAESGAAINFFKEKGRIRLEINPDSAARSGIQLRARLLQIGKIVRERER